MTFIACVVQWGPVVETFVVNFYWVAGLALFEHFIHFVVHAAFAVVSELLVIFLYFFPEIVPVFLHLFRVDLYFFNKQKITAQSFGNVINCVS